jgi:hypothetical protein
MDELSAAIRVVIVTENHWSRRGRELEYMQQILPAIRCHLFDAFPLADAPSQEHSVRS